MEVHITYPVYLIGGAPGAGKTTLGRALADRLGAVSLTVDDLVTAMQGVERGQEHSDLHRIGRHPHVEYFTETPLIELQADAEALHAAAWPGVSRVIGKRAKYGPAYVLDGWGFEADRIGDLGVPTVRAVWIDIDRDVLEGRERDVWPFYEQSHDPERMLASFLARSFWWNDRVVSRARTLGLPVLVQDGTQSVEDLCDEVLEVAPL